MSDNQYQDYGGQYDQYGYDDNNYDNDNMMDQQQQQQDYQTRVQLEYFQAQQMLRKGNVQQCLQSLQNLYKLSIEHNLRNWKPKILNLQLQIYTNRQKNQQKLLSTLQMIIELNRKQKYTQSSIKSIMMTMKQLDKEGFQFVREKLYQFVQEMDQLNRVRSLLGLVERGIDQGDYEEGQRLVDKVQKIRRGMESSGRDSRFNINNFNTNNNNNMAIITTSPQITTLPPSLLIQLYSHQITLYKHLHNHNNNKNNNIDSFSSSISPSQPITQLITRIHLTLPQLQSQSYLSDSHLSTIKQSISQIKYQQQDYLQCSKLLCQAFQQQMKYGKDHNKKKLLLKINVLVALLTEDREVYMKDKCNALYHQSAASFKSENDVQALYGLVEAFNNGDYGQFLEQMKTVNYIVQTQNQENKSSISSYHYYPNLVQKVITLIKSNKLLQIIKPYNKIKFSYLSRRLNCDQQQIYQIVFRLIMQGKIDGRIKRDDDGDKKQGDYCLVINNEGNERDQYLVGQLENVKGLLGRKFV